MSKADERNDITVEEYIQTLQDGTLQSDAIKIADMMQRISGQKPQLYGFGTIGFGVYEYHYKSGRKGDAHTIAFYPRKGKITVYISDGTNRYSDLLDKLGKHTITGYCVYIKQLSDIDFKVLEQIVQKSYDNIAELSKDGPIDHILWQDEK